MWRHHDVEQTYALFIILGSGTPNKLQQARTHTQRSIRNVGEKIKMWSLKQISKNCKKTEIIFICKLNIFKIVTNTALFLKT